jgi:hypothetical protein
MQQILFKRLVASSAVKCYPHGSTSFSACQEPLSALHGHVKNILSFLAVDIPFTADSFQVICCALFLVCVRLCTSQKVSCLSPQILRHFIKAPLIRKPPGWQFAAGQGVLLDFRKFVDVGHGAVAELVYNLAVGKDFLLELVEFFAVLTADIIVRIGKLRFLKRILRIGSSCAAI